MQNSTRQIRRYVSTPLILVSAYLLFVFTPTFYIASSNYYSMHWYTLSEKEYRNSADLAFIINNTFFVLSVLGYILSGFFHKAVLGSNIKRRL